MPLVGSAARTGFAALATAFLSWSAAIFSILCDSRLRFETENFICGGGGERRQGSGDGVSSGGLAEGASRARADGAR